MKISDPGAYLERQRDAVEKSLAGLFDPGGEPALLWEAMRYSVDAGGKRLRPLLALAAAETLGHPGEKVLPVASALELIHTYSLIHDDLPAMDDSDLRRGKPACHRVYGEAIAILAGDALLTLAFELVAGYGMQEGRPVQALQIGLELARAAGRQGMVGGQVLDLEAEGKTIGSEGLEKIDRFKTGALLQAAVRCGAIAAGASPAQMKAFSGYGSCLGLAFQITDDLLDLEGDAAEMGKETGADRARGKATFPALLGTAAARRRAGELYRDALNNLDALERPAELLRELARQLVFRNK